MRISVFVVLLFLFPLCIWAQSGPKLVVDGGEQINAGSHMRGQEVKYEIKFSNNGDADLKITSLSTSCGCSTALLSSDVIKPGEQGTINFTFNGNGFGQVSKAVNIVTNEPAGSNTHSIVISMTMVDPVNFTPNSIILEGKVGDELSQSIMISNFYDKNITLIDLSSNSPAVKVSSNKTEIVPGESANLEVKINLYEDSEVNAAVLVKSSQGDFQIPVLVTVRAN